MKNKIDFVIHDSTGNADTTVISFLTEFDSAEKALNAAKNAIRRYMKSSEILSRDIPEVFNWGDVLINVPDLYFIIEGLQPIPDLSQFTIELEHDENLIPEVT